MDRRVQPISRPWLLSDSQLPRALESSNSNRAKSRVPWRCSSLSLCSWQVGDHYQLPPLVVDSGAAEG